MSNSSVYIVTATPASEKAEADKLYWNSDGYTVRGTTWTPLLCEVEAFAEETDAIELKEKLQKMIDETENKKRLIVKDVTIEVLDRKKLLIAKMKGT